MEKKWWGLLRRRECFLPTWRGWLVVLGCLTAFTIWAVREAYPFLAVNDGRPGGLLVVEGWMPDYALATAVEEFKRAHYDKVFVTGGPIESGAPLSEYKTYAELGAAVMQKLGLDTNTVQAVPAPLVRQDRTYTSALSLRRWLRTHGIEAGQIHLMSEGAHARRSRLLMEKALGKGVKVGVTAIPARDFDERHWWRSSAGVRGVIGEGLAYGYARLMFREPNE